MSANKKPRKKYRGAKPQLPDPVSWVVNGMLPLSAADIEVCKIRNINHGAVTDLVQGVGTRESGVVLRNMLITAMSIADCGKGTDWMPELQLAAGAVDSLLARGQRTGRYLFTGLELTAVNLAVDVHDAQIDGCTIAEFEGAIKLAMKKRGLVT